MSIINMIDKFDTKPYVPGKVATMTVGIPIVIHGMMKVTDSKTKKGDPYLKVSITDTVGKTVNQLIFTGDSRYGFLKDYIGNDVESDIYTIPVKNGVYINLDIKNVVVQIPDPVEKEKVETSKDSKKAAIYNKIDFIVSPFIKAVVNEVYSHEGLLDKVLIAPATEFSGYNYVGGLSDLIITTSNFAQTISDAINIDTSYEGSLTVNPDIILAGALLCNVGKAYMLEWNEDFTKISKTERGVLDNDLSLVRTLVSNAISKVASTKDEAGNNLYVVRNDVCSELLHMIDSCKGQVQWGAIVVPRTKHAMILSQICQMAFTKGLFENLEKKSGDEKFIKAYDNGRMYFLPESYIDM